MEDLNQIVYFVSFKHGDLGKRLEENEELFMNEVEEITDIQHIKAIEAELGKKYTNPKVIDFKPLRRRIS